MSANGTAEVLHRIGATEEKHRTLEAEVRALSSAIKALSVKVDHLSTLMTAAGNALEWLVRDKKLRKRKKAA